MKTGSFEQMKREFTDGTYNLTCNGKCTGCGECCSNALPMTDKEIEIIRKYIKRYNIKETKHVFPLINHVFDLTCPFLDNNKSCEKCKIYEVRPRICRDFICDPKQRKELDFDYKIKCKLVNVRSEFYETNNISHRK